MKIHLLIYSGRENTSKEIDYVPIWKPVADAIVRTLCEAGPPIDCPFNFSGGVLVEHLGGLYYARDGKVCTYIDGQCLVFEDKWGLEGAARTAFALSDSIARPSDASLQSAGKVLSAYVAAAGGELKNQEALTAVSKWLLSGARS